MYVALFMPSFYFLTGNLRVLFTELLFCIKYMCAYYKVYACMLKGIPSLSTCLY